MHIKETAKQLAQSTPDDVTMFWVSIRPFDAHHEGLLFIL